MTALLKLLELKKDGQAIREINDEIDRARFKAQENRLYQIVVLMKLPN